MSPSYATIFSMTFPRQSNRRSRAAAYTLVEVSVAAAILGLTIASALVTMRMGYAMIEGARDNTLASQILQSEMENLRLMNWAKLADLDDGSFELEGSFQGTAANRFSGSRTIETPVAGLRQVVLEVTWTSYSGLQRSRRYMTYFSKDGLNDYYYRSLPAQ
jgi:type II secretory pathway pseudopilin PulG